MSDRSERINTILRSANDKDASDANVILWLLDHSLYVWARARGILLDDCEIDPNCDEPEPPTN